MYNMIFTNWSVFSDFYPGIFSESCITPIIFRYLSMKIETTILVHKSASIVIFI